MAAKVINPTLVVGLGEWGRRVAEVVRAAGAVGGEDAHDHARFVVAVPDAATDEWKADVSRALEELLGIEKAARVGAEQPGWRAPLDVFLLANLDGASTHGDVSLVLEALDTAFGPYAGLFQGRGGRQVFVSPVLLLPSMDPLVGATGEDADGQEAANEARALIRGWLPHFEAPAGPGPWQLPLARCYLVEPRTDAYPLSLEERTIMVRSFLQFLLYASVRRDSKGFQAAYQRTDHGDPDPFGTFVVGSVHVPATALREVAADRAALLGLRAFEKPGTTDAADQETEYLHLCQHLAQEVRALPETGRKGALDRFLADHIGDPTARLRETGTFESPGALLDEYGAGWETNLLEHLLPREPDGMDAFSRTMKGFVSDVSADAAALGRDLAARTHQDVDGWLGQQGSHHGDAARNLVHVHDALRTELVDARAAADGPYDPGVSEATVRSAVGALRRTIDDKPEPWPMLVAGLPAIVFIGILGAPVQRLLFAAFESPGGERPAWLFLFRDHPFNLVTALVL